jgi:hypothetical protein
VVPLGKSLPKVAYEAKKYTRDLGLGYEKIVAGHNGCMLFWKHCEDLETCTACGMSKLKQVTGGAVESSTRAKRRLEKVLR